MIYGVFIYMPHRATVLLLLMFLKKKSKKTKI